MNSTNNRNQEPLTKENQSPNQNISRADATMDQKQKKSSLFEKIGRGIDRTLQDTISSGTQWTKEEFFEMLSKPIDQQIIDTVKTQGLSYEGGEIELELRAEQVKFVAKTYYQNKKGEWITKTIKNGYNFICFEDGFLKELSSMPKDKLKYQIESPL